MRTYSELDVNLVNLETFEFYPGGEEFTKEFSELAISRLRFRFEEAGILEKAKNKLNEHQISYNEFYGVVLESDEELESYPLAIIVFNSQYNVLSEKLGELKVNSLVAAKALNKDIETGKLVVQEYAKLFLEEKCSNISFVEISNENKKSTYFLTNLPNIKNPRIIGEKFEILDVREGDDVFYQPIEIDGRFAFPKETIAELNDNPLLGMKSFSLNGKLHETSKVIYLIKGSLALAFKNFFDFDKENISLIIPPLDII